MPSHPYGGRVASLATMHGKERAIATPFRTMLGLEVIATEGLNTDALGTFSGDIPRVGSIGEVASRKARLGMDLLGTRLGLASEGSFGPHPGAPFLTVGRELLKFVDAEKSIEIAESLTTLANACETLEWRRGVDIAQFLERSRFPSHGLVAHAKDDAGRLHVVKDLLSEDDIARALETLASLTGTGAVVLANDMRAHRNPTRMASLAELASRLAARIATPCPKCGLPGFGARSPLPGLPCSACGLPTPSARGERLACVSCDYAETHARPDGRIFEEPTYCERCNP